MTGKEWLIAMGEPLDGASDVFESFVGPALSALPADDQKKLVGWQQFRCVGVWVLCAVLY